MNESHDDDKWKRLLIALNDLAESKQYIEAYVAFADTPAYSEAYGAVGLEMARRMEDALLSCGLISYARPFVQSRGLGWKKVPGRFTSGYTKEERRIHNYVLDARKKLIAHSDIDGVFTDRTVTNNSNVIWSARSAPIVMIPGQADSLDISLASERAEALAKVTRDEFKELVEDIEPSGDPIHVVLHEHRAFDVDVSICATIVEMITKVGDAICTELGIREETS